ncbi:MAG: hypothetical protein HZB25_09825 [Candidatus Eisenbacteria bacterium]|nr:hypothetical protein [Candidatus Eisenbacteria bacterium]
MILVRSVFQLKFGKAREAREAWEQVKPIMSKVGSGATRTMTDFTGPFYTFVLETSHANFAAFEKHLQEVTGNAEWKQWYAKFTPLVESGRREIFTILE